ncbi:MAG: DNA mismatch repair protein MutS [Acidimicrobiia bacterium]|nr:MAG: DNA mismatch repair protein MutS [Acidimicrobiia bacterium]
MLKVRLMHRDRDVDPQQELPPNEEALTQDLELNSLFEAMALGDVIVFDMAKRGVLSSLSDPEAIVYRQEVLADCLDHPSIAREIYDIAVAAIEGEKKFFLGGFSDSPDMVLSRSVRMLGFLVSTLKRLRKITDEYADGFRSEGFQRLFDMLESEFDDVYIQTIEGQLRDLSLRHGVLVSAVLGKGNKGTDYVLRKPRGKSWLRWPPIGIHTYSFEIADRDMNGAKALSRIRARGVNLAANAVAQATDQFVDFFGTLRTELAFYIGCLNLADRLAEKDEPTCFPVPVDAHDPALCAQGLYDVSLALLNPGGRVVGNDVLGDGKLLVMITGANQGGKSTFLRSLGLAQLMLQSGMFVAATSFRANVCRGIFTHYLREEDSAMESGKLDEELRRMSDIADEIGPGCILLCNESFSSTNEREGSEIARQVVRALVEAGVKVFFVTHLFDLAQSVYRTELESALFLRAERGSDGLRPFKLVQGAPLPTSFGEDVYRQIFAPIGDTVIPGPPM